MYSLHFGYAFVCYLSNAVVHVRVMAAIIDASMHNSANELHCFGSSTSLETMVEIIVGCVLLDFSYNSMLIFSHQA